MGLGLQSTLLAAEQPRRGGDPLAAAIARWEGKLRAAAQLDSETKSIYEAYGPLVGDAARALAQGQRWLALSRLERVWATLEATEYAAALPDADLSAGTRLLESEWQRFGSELGVRQRPGPRPAFELLPAAARAFAEVALAEMPVYYQSSLDYGRNTAPEYGLFYLGSALANRQFVTLVAGLEKRPATTLALRPREITPEIAATRAELLRAYVPPQSIDQHSTFIRISALLKEADELTEQGSLYGALLRYLDGKARLARWLHPGRAISADEAALRAATFAARLRESPRDSTLQQLFLETALFSASLPDPAAGGGELAAAIFEEVLPAFPALLGPAPPAPPERLAEATVTLVRWPYT